ncbi:hypothetical protein KGM_214496 [Danaus plexippus plexippus]|uniref:Proteoglycan 4 n=1 Tax=Danaus plexippus plexippus TaxID=278856 RepID=A0A212FHB1_DANPL|nr:hypothetical protein KGM_214496 [Danaus plexippus plexippus]
MATKSYSKHKEYKEYSSTRGTVPYTDEQFDMLKSELIPKGSKLDSLGRNAVGTREYHYEYKEEKLPSGKYDRKDLHSVEEYTIPPKTAPKSETSSYYYEREERELPSITTGTRTYNYETTGSSPGGYASDTAESTSFDYRKGTPAKAPSSGYSTLQREARSESSWGSAPVRAEVRQEVYREEKHESRVVPSQVSPAVPQVVPPAVCSHCHHPPSTGTLSRSGTPMNKVTTTVKTYTYEVPADQDPTTVPIPTECTEHHHLDSTVTSTTSAPVKLLSPPGCQFCSHCNTRREYRVQTDEHSSERAVYPQPSQPTNITLEPQNGHGPYGPSYKYSETSYSSSNTTQRFPRSTSPSPGRSPHPPPSHIAPSPSKQRFPTQPDGVVRRKVEVTHESSSSNQAKDKDTLKHTPPVATSKNVQGPAVYYPPGHTPFAKKDNPVGGYQSSAMMQGGGAYASGRGMYEYEAGSRSKEKHTEKKTAVPICLPLCCAMPCVIM